MPVTVAQPSVETLTPDDFRRTLDAAERGRREAEMARVVRDSIPRPAAVLR